MLPASSQYTVATLPNPSAMQGYVAMVSDSMVSEDMGSGSVVVGGGPVRARVRSDGTFWRIAGNGQLVGAIPAAGSSYNFAGSVSLPSSMTFTRASTAWGTNSALQLASYATNTPRFVSDPSSGAYRGLLIETAVANNIRNASAGGAVNGTPGTLPTNWVWQPNVGGLNTAVIGSGTEDGIPYLDLRIFGTPLATGNPLLLFDATNSTAALNGQTWAGSFYVSLVGGSLTNVSNTNIVLAMYDAANAFINQGGSSGTIGSGALRNRRVNTVVILNQAATAFVQMFFQFQVTNGQAIDMTLRLGVPQLSQLEGTTSPILTTAGALTRAVDVARITAPAALTDQVWIFKGRTAPFTPVGAQALFQIDAGDFNNRLVCWRDSGNNFQIVCVNGGVAQSQIGFGPIANDTNFGLAIRFATNNFAASINKGAVTVNASGTRTPGLVNARIGTSDVAGQEWNGTISYIEHRASATNSELQALSGA